MDQSSTLDVIVVLTVLSEVVCQTDNANAQGTAPLGCSFCTLDRVTLVVNQLVEGAHSKVTEVLQFGQSVADLAHVDGRQDAQ